MLQVFVCAQNWGILFSHSRCNLESTDPTKLGGKFIIRPGWCLGRTHDEEHDGRHGDFCFGAVVIVLWQWIRCLEHGEWVRTKSNFRRLRSVVIL